jgi:hypothetical protein
MPDSEDGPTLPGVPKTLWPQIAAGLLALVGAVGYGAKQDKATADNLGEHIEAKLRQHVEHGFHKDTKPLWERIRALEDDHDEALDDLEDRVTRLEAQVEALRGH